MGRCLATLLCGRCELVICSRDLHKAEAVARRAEAKATGTEGCSDRQVVILAVPNSSLIEVAGEVSRIMPSGSLLVDISSVKRGVTDEVEGAIPSGINYISIHPLFYSPRSREKNTIVVPVRPGTWLSPLTSLLEGSGMVLKETGVEEHDGAMAAVQVAHHFALLSLKVTLARMGFWEKGDLEPFMTRSLEKSLRVIRSLERNIATIEMIQKENGFSQMARATFLDEARKLDIHYSEKS
jgi:prephenate dehydrogenase